MSQAFFLLVILVFVFLAFCSGQVSILMLNKITLISNYVHFWIELGK